MGHAFFLFWQVPGEPNHELGCCKPVSFAQNQKVLLSSIAEHAPRSMEDRMIEAGPWYPSPLFSREKGSDIV